MQKCPGTHKRIAKYGYAKVSPIVRSKVPKKIVESPYAKVLGYTNAYENMAMQKCPR